MTLPSASSTACEVKFSEGIRLIKCFWRFFSCNSCISNLSRVLGRKGLPRNYTYIFDDVKDGRIGLLQVRGEELLPLLSVQPLTLRSLKRTDLLLAIMGDR